MTDHRERNSDKQLVSLKRGPKVAGIQDRSNLPKKKGAQSSNKALDISNGYFKYQDIAKMLISSKKKSGLFVIYECQELPFEDEEIEDDINHQPNVAYKVMRRTRIPTVKIKRILRKCN
jgi:hypothetical protein